MISPDRYRSRQDAVRRAMGERGIDALVVAGAGDHGKRGHLQYLTGHTLWDREGACVLLPDGTCVLTLLTVSQAFWARGRGIVSEVRVNASLVRELAAVLTAPRSGAVRRLGLAGFDGVVSLADHASLVAALPGAEVVDLTDALRRLEAVKDADELISVRESAAIADAGYRVFLDRLRPGAGEWELSGAAQGEMFSRGVFDTMPLFMHRRGEPYLSIPRDLRLEPGECGSYSVEVPSPDGYWVELARMFSVGRPSAEDREQVDCLLAIHRDIQRRLRPGQACGELAERAVSLAEERGHSIGIWLGHGIGLHLPEWPELVRGVDVELEADMVVAVHPHVISRDGRLGVYVGDTYVVTEDGGDRLSEIPLDLVVVG